MIVEPRLLKLNFGIMCLHILLMSTFVALPGQLAAAGFPAAEHWKIYLVTMLISFVSVVPFIIYAEVKRKMKRVFVGCVAVLLIAEIVLWGAGPHCLIHKPCSSPVRYWQQSGYWSPAP